MKLSYTLSLLAVSLLMAGSANAASVIKRYSATNCAYETDYVNDYWLYPSNISNASSNRARSIFCPLNDPETVQYLAVDGFDANNDPSTGVPTAKICQADNLGYTVVCSSPVYLMGGTSTGLFSTWLPTSVLAPLAHPDYSGWYADLVISIPQTGLYGKSFIRGYYRT